MTISVLKEIKEDEKRVALRPDQINILCENGHKIYIETKAGEKSGFSDEMYKKHGAIICSKYKALKEGKLLLKVKAPLYSEFKDYTKKQILFTYLHLDENISRNNIRKLIKSGFTGIAYEYVGDDRERPLVNNMSKLTGYLFSQKAMDLCIKYKGIFIGKYEKFLPSGNVLIIGLGNIGMSVLKYFINNKVIITVVDKDSRDEINKKLNLRFNSSNLDYLKENSIKVINFDMLNILKTKKSIDEIITKFDIIINCAVRRENLPKEKLDYLIDKKMVSKMVKGSVICDATACDKDMIETCSSSSSIDEVYFYKDIVHYNCDHIPSIAYKSSTHLLTESTFSYINLIANNGMNKSLKLNKYLRHGVVCHEGFITNKYIAQKKNLDYAAITY